MSRTLATIELGRGHRTHKPTEAHLAHVERVKKSEKLRNSIRYNKNVREGDSSPEYTDEEEDTGHNNQRMDAEPPKDALAQDLDNDEAYRQMLIARVSKLKNRTDLGNWDVEDLEKQLASGPDTQKKTDQKKKPDPPKLFDNSAKVKDNGPARDAIPAPKTGRTNGPAPASRRKRARSPSSEPEEKRRPPKERNRRASQYPSPARSTFSSKSRSSIGPSRVSSTNKHRRPASKARSRSKSEARSHADEGDGVSDARSSDAEGEGGWEDDEDDRMTSVSTKQKADRGKRSDFKGVELELVDLTFFILISTLFRKVPFPTNQQYTECIYASWDKACKTLKLSRQQHPIEKGHKESIRDRVNSFRGRLRDVMKDLFEVVFAFQDGELSEQQIVKKVKELLPNKLHQKPKSKPGTGWFAHEWVQRAICKAFFMGRHPVAIKFPREWDPVPARAVAVVCGFMYYYLDKWKGGKRPEPPLVDGTTRVKRMNFYDVLPFYQKQWAFMKRFRDSPDQGDRCAVVLSDLYDRCLTAVGQKRIDADDESNDGDFSRNDEDDFAVDAPTAEEIARIRHRSVSAASVGGSERGEEEDKPEPEIGSPKTEPDDLDSVNGADPAHDGTQFGHDGVRLADLGDDEDEDILGSPPPDSGSGEVPVTPAVAEPEKRPSDVPSGADRAKGSARPLKKKLEVVIGTPARQQAGSSKAKGPRAALISGHLKVVGSKGK